MQKYPNSPSMDDKYCNICAKQEVVIFPPGASTRTGVIM